jgi:hypothetical protein
MAEATEGPVLGSQGWFEDRFLTVPLGMVVADQKNPRRRARCFSPMALQSKLRMA